MPRRASPHPTEAELEILQVLWRQAPSTVREVHETLQEDRQTSLTTTLKLLQVMLAKGLVTREDEVRPHGYSPAVPEEQTQMRLLDDLIQRAFGGSASKLLICAVRDRALSREELREIRKLIDAVEHKRGGRRR